MIIGCVMSSSADRSHEPNGADEHRFVADPKYAALPFTQVSNELPASLPQVGDPTISQRDYSAPHW
jgi:hypothetical protein